MRASELAAVLMDMVIAGEDPHLDFEVWYRTTDKVKCIQLFRSTEPFQYKVSLIGVQTDEDK